MGQFYRWGQRMGPLLVDNDREWTSCCLVLYYSLGEDGFVYAILLLALSV